MNQRPAGSYRREHCVRHGPRDRRGKHGACRGGDSDVAAISRGSRRVDGSLISLALGAAIVKNGRVARQHKRGSEW